MTANEQRVEVDRELELIIDVTESGVVKIRLTGGAVKTELRAGDQLVVVLAPSAPKKQPPGTDGGTWNGNGSGPDRPGNGGVDAQRVDRDFFGGAAPRAHGLGMADTKAGER